MLKEYSLEGKVAIVTGAGRGIGKGIVLTLAEAGADIAAAARTVDEINKVADEVRQLGRRCLSIPTDVTKVDQVQRMVDGAISEFGKIDILVNNAGGSRSAKPIIPLPDFRLPKDIETPDFYTPWSLEEWRDIMNLDLDAIFLCTKAVGNYMMKQRSGKIINIASAYAAIGSGSDFNVAYCTAKAAVVRFTGALAREWARYNINVNCIGPGLVQTPAAEKAVLAKERIKQAALRAIPLRRIGTPRDIALLAVYLASDASSWMTGQTIYCDGGHTIA